MYNMLNRGGVKMENLNAPLLIRPSKTNPIFFSSSKSLPTMGSGVDSIGHQKGD